MKRTINKFIPKCEWNIFHFTFLLLLGEVGLHYIYYFLRQFLSNQSRATLPISTVTEFILSAKASISFIGIILNSRLYPCLNLAVNFLRRAVSNISNDDHSEWMTLFRSPSSSKQRLRSLRIKLTFFVSATRCRYKDIKSWVSCLKDNSETTIFPISASS
jgi:hypothetical protein